VKEKNSKEIKKYDYLFPAVRIKKSLATAQVIVFLFRRYTLICVIILFPNNRFT